MKAAMAALLLLTFAAALLHAGEGAPMLRYNDQQFELKYAYAFQMKIPDMDAMSEQDMQAGRTKWKKVLAIALSDKPFDAAALAKLDSPIEAFEKMVKDGAALVTVVGGKGGAVEMVQVALPKKDTALQLDTSSATLTLNPGENRKVNGHLVIQGDHKMHDFDPQNIPLIEADVRFVVSVP